MASVISKRACAIALFAASASALVAPGAAAAATPSVNAAPAVNPIHASVNCNPPPPSPAPELVWEGNCWNGTEGSPAGESCTRTGSQGQTEHFWKAWRCEGELRNDNRFYYFLFVDRY
ncbi:hypothetical protein [Amycolatopsis minnesotensis]|uniref:Uncharacterized protein n=1 Tax=Amycolatopsis minnesotensis TaxID=337894 RepID=A0ABP5E8U8_9PSEU